MSVKPETPNGTKAGSEEFHELLGQKEYRTLREEWYQFYSQNPAHFMRDCIKIADKHGNQCGLDLNHPYYKRAQHKYFMVLWTQWKDRGRVRIVVLKARQWGCTTVTQGFILWVMVFHPFTTGMDIADDGPGAEAILEMINEMHDNLPDWIRTETEYQATSRIKFNGYTIDKKEKVASPRQNRSWLRVATANKAAAGRKHTLRVVHFSEVAYFGKDAKEVLLGARNAVPKTDSGTLVVLESTAHGWGGVFYDECKYAMAGRGGYEFVFIPWFLIDEYRIRPGDRRVEDLNKREVPVRDPLMYQSMLQKKDYVTLGLDEKEIELYEGGNVDAEQLLFRRWSIDADAGGDLVRWQQEYPATVEEAFIATGKPTFYPTALIRMAKTNTSEPEWVGEVVQDDQGNMVWVDQPHGRVKLWEKPNPEHEYIIGVDPAEGSELKSEPDTDGDNSTVLVWNRHTRQFVGQVMGRYTPDDTGEMAMALGNWFNLALVVIENNGGFGYPILMMLKNAYYHNIYTKKSYDETLDRVTYTMGWNTNEKSRWMMFSTAQAAIRRRNFIPNSMDLVEELMAVVNKRLPGGGVRPEAKAGCHDDLATNCCMVLQVDAEAGELIVVVSTKPKVDPNNRHAAMWEAFDKEYKEPEFAAW